MTIVLILYASLGAGHLNAAKALTEAFAQFPNVEVHSQDALEYASPIYRSSITQIYKQLSEKIPILYKAIYEGTDIEDVEESLDDNLSVARLESFFFGKLEDFVTQTQPDVIISVQQIPSRLIQLLKQRDHLSTPHYVVVTDAIAHSSWLNHEINAYFLPSSIGVNMLIQRGANPDLLHVTGIPIKLEVLEAKSQAEMRSRHNLPLDRPVVSLFGGGINPQRVKMIVADFLAAATPLTVIVNAGRSETLLDAIADLTDSELVKLVKLGSINYVDDLIVASDLIITKAGGLITSEILARGVPMIIIDPIPGQEEQNADVISASGAGIQIRLPEMVVQTVLYLLNAPDRLEQMHQAAIATGQPRAALDIAEFILKDIQSYQEATLVQ
jgi:processive 1,2-diacylglycerol beta-glucosyltransferase